jgi:4-aminobutyrate aminotransferase-like enzyme
MVTAAKQLALLEAGVLDNCREMGAYLGDGIRALSAEYPEIGDVRQAGLHIGVEFVADPETRDPLVEETAAIRTAGFSNGIIFGLGGVRRNVLKVKPPLIVNRVEADEILEKLQSCMEAALRT